MRNDVAEKRSSRDNANCEYYETAIAYVNISSYHYWKISKKDNTKQ